MPRGLRAVYGQERDGVHARWGDGGGLTTRVSPTAERLVSVCWCGRRFLRVDQNDVLNLTTQSCEWPDCRDPHGVHVFGEINDGIEGSVAHSAFEGRSGASPSMRAFSQEEIAALADAPVFLRSARHITPQSKREARVVGFDLAMRREDVLHLWRQGKSIDAIGRELSLCAITVENDISWLRQHRRLTADVALGRSA